VSPRGELATAATDGAFGICWVANVAFRDPAGRPLVSLDELMFEDGTATKGDNVSRGLWD
jgi:hypothetical protein